MTLTDNFSKVRNNSIDAIKGMAMVLVVCGHCGAPFTHLIYLFHMAVFFMASGFCWNEKHAENFKSFVSYSISKIKTLWIPYAVCNILFVLFNNLFVFLNIYSSDSILSFSQMVLESVKSLLFLGGTPMGGATWFLRILFIVNVTHCLLGLICNKLKINKIVLLCIMLVVCGGVSWLVDIGIFKMPFENFFASYMAYLLGVIIRKIQCKFKHCSFIYYIIVAGVALIILCVLNFFGGIALNRGHITNPFYYILASLCGWIFLNGLAECIPVKLKILLGYIGRKSLSILLLHFISFKLVTMFFILIFRQDITLLNAFPVPDNAPSYLWILYCLAGVGIPLSLERLYGTVKSVIIKNVLPNRLKKEKL